MLSRRPLVILLFLPPPINDSSDISIWLPVPPIILDRVEKTVILLSFPPIILE